MVQHLNEYKQALTPQRVSCETGLLSSTDTALSKTTLETPCGEGPHEAEVLLEVKGLWACSCSISQGKLDIELWSPY